MKPSPAQEILESELGEPILARWHVGLGWTLAWTSDVKNLWAVEWLRWPQWGQFWGQLVREHMRQKKRQVFDMRAEIDPATGHVQAVLDAVGGDDAFQNGLEASLAVAGPELGIVGAPPRRPARCRCRRPRRSLRGRLPARSLRVVPAPRVAREAGGRSAEPWPGRPRKTATVAESFGHVTNPYPREYLALAPDVATLARAAGVDRRSASTPRRPTSSTRPARSIRYHEDLWPRFVGGAIALLLLDLLVRRVRLFDRKRTFKAGSKRAGAAPA